MFGADSISWLPEYEALTQGAGIVDLSARSRIELTGADRVTFLHSFCTSDMRRLTPGQGCEAFLTSHQGKTVGHVFVRIGPDSIWLDAAPQQVEKLIAHLNRFVISDRVDFHDRTDETGELLLAGKEAESTWSRAAGQPLPTRLSDHADLNIAESRVSAQKVDFLAAGSFFLTLPRTQLSAVMETLHAAGAALCRDDALHAARIESGTPLFGSDITEENLPQEINRNEQAISFTKGCYLGQETVARIDAMGHVNRLLAGLRFSGAQIPPPGTELTQSGKPVGKVTSSCWSPRLRSPLALALVRRSAAAAGSMLASDLGEAEVIGLPLA